MNQITYIVVAPGGKEVKRVTVDSATTPADVRFFEQIPEDHNIIEADAWFIPDWDTVRLDMAVEVDCANERLAADGDGLEDTNDNDWSHRAGVNEKDR